MLIPGAYLSSSTTNPKRIFLKEESPVTIVEQRSDSFVVAMIDTQTQILVHKDSVRKIQ